MGKCDSKYKEEILRLRKEGKKYWEIAEILNCSKSIISYYTNNKEYERSRLARIRNTNDRKSSRLSSVERNRIFVRNYLENNPCIDCGNSDIRVLEFDHVRGKKEANVSNAVRNAWELNRLKLEIDKCEIRCANCHRIATIERRINKSIINQ